MKRVNVAVMGGTGMNAMLNAAGISKEEKKRIRIFRRAVLVCTEGPRPETPAEIQMFRRLGCDIVGMTDMHKAVLAREIEMGYATICFVTNRATGLEKHLRINKLTEMTKKTTLILQQVLKEAILNSPENRQCICANGVKETKIQG